jgi:hypothetical protein
VLLAFDGFGCGPPPFVASPGLVSAQRPFAADHLPRLYLTQSPPGRRSGAVSRGLPTCFCESLDAYPAGSGRQSERAVLFLHQASTREAPMQCGIPEDNTTVMLAAGGLTHVLWRVDLARMRRFKEGLSAKFHLAMGRATARRCVRGAPA